MSLVEIAEPAGGEWAEGAEIPGYKARITPRGIRVVELDPWADPQKRLPSIEEWLANKRRLYPSEAEFRAELCRDWSTHSGEVFFPEFSRNGGVKRYVREVTALLDGPIHRGWDFGNRAPACVWFQYDAKNRRAFVLRSLTPTYTPTHSFRDLVRYLSGELPRTSLDVEWAAQWLARIEADPTQPPTPWFQPKGATPLQFLDWGGSMELHQNRGMQQKTSDASSWAEVLAEGGVYINSISAATSRDQLMRRLLSLAPDGWPRILFDPANPLLIKAVSSGLVWKPPTLNDPNPETYLKDGLHDNVYEALTYGLVGVIPLATFDAPQQMTLIQDRKPVRQEGNSMFHEGNKGVGWE